MRGLTLVELVVALGIAAVGLTVAGLSLRTLRPTAAAMVIARLDSTRATAILRGRAQVVTLLGRDVWFQPDGSASAAAIRVESVVVRVEPLTGEVHVARR